MGDLLLNSLEIENFRLFEKLTIEKLGRINLIVGENNTGKTSLLEALWLYFGSGHSSIAQKIQENRNESSSASLYYGRKLGQMTIGTLDGKIDIDKNKHSSIKIKEASIQSASTIFIPSQGLKHEQVVELWDEIILSDKEDRINESLQLIDPRCRRVNLISKSEKMPRLPFAKVQGFDEPIPLRSLGEGMNRLFEISLALVQVKDGALLIDEIENGLHYSVQPQIWKLFFQMAENLNIQVFVTTHSWDCIRALQEASQEHPETSVMLINLRWFKGKIKATSFTRGSLENIVSDEMEVR